MLWGDNRWKWKKPAVAGSRTQDTSGLSRQCSATDHNSRTATILYMHSKSVCSLTYTMYNIYNWHLLYIVVIFPRRSSMSPKGTCCSGKCNCFVGCYPSNPLSHPLSPPLFHFKFKHLVAKQHPTSLDTCALVPLDMGYGISGFLYCL